MDLWQSRVKAPDQNECRALGKCFQVEPSTVFLLIKVVDIDSFKFLS